MDQGRQGKQHHEGKGAGKEEEDDGGYTRRPCHRHDGSEEGEDQGAERGEEEAGKVAADAVGELAAVTAGTAQGKDQQQKQGDGGEDGNKAQRHIDQHSGNARIVESCKDGAQHCAGKGQKPADVFGTVHG